MRLTIKNGEIEFIAGRVMGGMPSNSLASLSQSSTAVGGISTVNSARADSKVLTRALVLRN
jgi:hypothetical protein